MTIARKLILAVGGGSLLVYVAVVLIVGRMGRLAGLDILEHFAEDFAGSRAAQVGDFLRTTEALARTVAVTLPPAAAADERAVERSLCGALHGSVTDARLLVTAASGGGWACTRAGAERRFGALAAAVGPGPAAGAWDVHPSGEVAFRLAVDAAAAGGAALELRVAREELSRLLDSLRPVRGAALLVGARDEVLAPLHAADDATTRAVVARLAAEPADRGRYQGRFPGLADSAWIAYRRVPATGWWLVVAVPESVIQGRLDSLRLVLAGLLLAGGVALIAVTAALARGITRPLSRLARAAGRIAGGDLESPTPPVAAGDEVGALARSFEEMRVSLRHHVAEVEKHAAARARSERDLKVAAEIQTGLLTTDFAGVTRGFRADLFAQVTPARHVGGDLYDVFRLDARHACVVLGDVSGKGLPAALFMSAARTAFRALAPHARRPAEILARVNETMNVDNPRGMYVTTFCAIVDLATGQIDFANAGHLPPAIVPAQGAARLEPERAGLPVAMMPGSRYDECTLSLAAGDTILLYTDGVPDALDEKDELFDNARLLARLDTAPRGDARALVEHLLAGVREFAGAAPQSDDIGLLALRWDGPAEPGGDPSPR